MKHPTQTVIIDRVGTPRFQQNSIVRYLIDYGSIDLNHLACLEFSDDDRMQLAQLIGYSVSGYSKLSYVSDESYEAAEMLASSAKAALEGDHE